MTGTTHFSAGAAVGAIAGALSGQPLAGAAVGGIAGLLADVDHPGSRLGQRVRPLAVFFEEHWGHRESPAHTLMFCLPVGFTLGLLAGITTGHAFALALAGALGAVSHLALDGMTKSGVRPFRVWLPEFPVRERFPAKVQELAGRWNAWATQVEEKTAKKHYRGVMKTGEDWREHAVAAASWLVVALLLVICK
jgi:inner membrane protein